MTNGFPEGVPRIGANQGQPKPQQVEVDEIVVTLNKPDSNPLRFRFAETQDEGKPDDCMAYTWLAGFPGLDIEKRDHSHVQVPLSSIAMIVLKVREVPDPVTQAHDILQGTVAETDHQQEEAEDGSES